MKNKHAKQMICTICQVKMKRADKKNDYFFKFDVDGLGFYFNDSELFIATYPFGIISVSAHALKGK